MTQTASLMWIPVFMQLLLVFGLYIMLGVAKSKAVALKQVDRSVAALDNRAWPEAVRRIYNNLDNQFQLPVLFYVLSVVAVLTHNSGLPTLLLAVLFVASRFVHSFIHIHSNYVPLRFKAFTFGALVLLALLIWLGVSIVIA